MVTPDRIRLRGLLQENPAICRVFLFLDAECFAGACITHASRRSEMGVAAHSVSRAALVTKPLIEPNTASNGARINELRKAVAYR